MTHNGRAVDLWAIAFYEVSGSSVVVDEQQGRRVLELGSPSVPSKRCS